MRTGIQWLTALTLCGLLVAAPKTAVRRLNGSTLSMEEIDGTVLRLMRAAEVTGVGIAIFHNGRVGYAKTYGLRDVAKQLPLTEDSVMAGASLSKAAFAYVVMQLVADGSLDLPPREPLPKHTEVAVDPGLLDRLTGRYAVEGAVLQITREEGHLLLQENQEAPGALFPEAALRFFSKTSDDVVTFELDGTGKVTRLVIHTGGRSIPVSRIE